MPCPRVLPDSHEIQKKFSPCNWPFYLVVLVAQAFSVFAGPVLYTSNLAQNSAKDAKYSTENSRLKKSRGSAQPRTSSRRLAARTAASATAFCAVSEETGSVTVSCEDLARIFERLGLRYIEADLCKSIHMYKKQQLLRIQLCTLSSKIYPNNELSCCITTLCAYIQHIQV